MSKLPVHGGPGPRSSRSSQYEHPFSRAQQAKPLYESDPMDPSQGGPLRGQAPTPAGQNPPPAGSAGSGSSSGTGGATPPPDPSQFDLSADPVLQQVQASIARANADLGASSLSQREQLLEDYGDPGLAASVLGASDPFAAAAGANQESVVARLKRAYEQGLAGYDTNLDPSLVFSGARIKGEGQIGQNYQDQRYSAAQSVQRGLEGITDAYTNARAGNQNTLDNALADAYARAVASAEANPPATGDSGTGDPGTPGTLPPGKHPPAKPKPKPKNALAHHARPHRQPH